MKEKKTSPNIKETYYNRSTRIFVLILGVLTGFSGLGHGFAEIIQGNKPTVDILTRIGAFSIIPNYLITGIVTSIISVAIIFWSINSIHKKFGPIIYLLLSLLLFLFGGGFAQIIGVLLTWAVATRINKPLKFWGKIMAGKRLNIFAKMWTFNITAAFSFLIIGIGMWLVLIPPGEAHAISVTHYITWFSLLIGLIFLFLAIISGFARDIKLRSKPTKVQ